MMWLLAFPIAWLLWCMFILCIAILYPMTGLAHVQGLFTNGVQIFNANSITGWPLDWQLAALTHERGHIRLLHCWKAIGRACLFRPIPDNYVLQHEYEADEYAFDRGYGLDLVMMLYTYPSKEGYLRARRLEEKIYAAQVQRDSGNLTRGMREYQGE